MSSTGPFPRGGTGRLGERRRTRTIAFPGAILAAAASISFPGRLPALIGGTGTIESRRTVGPRPAGESAGAIRSRTTADAGRTIRTIWTIRPGRTVELRWAIGRRAGRWPVFLWHRSIAMQVLRKTPPLLIARHLEAIARILVLTAWTPIARTSIPGRRALRATLREGVGAFLVLRRPQATAREPFHHRIGMAPLQLPQRRHQFFLRVRAERGGLVFENDRPVVVPRWHGFADYGSFGGAPCGSRRLSFSMRVVRFKCSNLAACRLLPWVRSSERRISESSTASM